MIRRGRLPLAVLLGLSCAVLSIAQEPGTNSPAASTPTSASPQNPNPSVADTKSVEEDVKTLEKDVKAMQSALKQEKQDPDFSLVLGIGSLIVGRNVTDYTEEAHVLRATNLGRATPQFLTGVAFRSRVPSLFRRYRDPRDPKYSKPELWQRNPWAGFVSLKFSPSASQQINGYVIGGLFSITHYLNALVGFALTPVNEPAPGFRVTASQFVTAQQAQGQYLNFDPVAMLNNKKNAFDGFPVADPTGRLIYQGNPTTVHYHGGAVFGVSIPIYFRSLFGGGGGGSNPEPPAPPPQ
jgi:hypothetical protein